MRNYRQKRLNYALFSGVIAFVAGWAISTILVSETTFAGAERWRSTLWIYLGAHGIPLSDVHLGGTGFNSRQPLSLVGSPSVVRYIPPILVTIAGAYTTSQISSRKLKRTVSNALTAGSAYFLIAVVAVVATDMQPGISVLLLIGGGIAAATWIGSSFLRTATRGLPFFGVTSLGTLLGLGFLFVAGGAALLSMLWKLVAISYAGTALAGILIGTERSLRFDGMRRNSEWPRLASARYRVRENWLEIVLMVAVGLLLYFALTNTI
ncbi:hypothetical protein [Halorubrum halophilum]|uniref:hypothetical protein n=1 Tax=Halorubrum halophilum TaxID=413816 RepID=UPI00186B2A5A|nr:hypothetical protein [Halorubrum halophilum]